MKGRYDLMDRLDNFSILICIISSSKLLNNILPAEIEAHFHLLLTQFLTLFLEIQRLSTTLLISTTFSFSVYFALMVDTKAVGFYQYFPFYI